MFATQNRWIFVGLLSFAALSGCDVNVVDCDKEPEAKICQDDEDVDAGDEPADDEDADVDAGKLLDGGAGGSKDGGAGGRSDAGADSSTTPDGSTPLTIDEFCVAKLATAVAWRDALEGLCGTKAEVSTRADFLERVLAYKPNDAEGDCITTLSGLVKAGNTTFDGSKALTCASVFAGNFAPPPDPFPADGIDLEMHEAKIAHGAPTLVQIPECRAAFKGKLVRDKVCSDNFECSGGLRCLPAPGGTKTCQLALVGGTCARNSDCADSYICVGKEASGGGRTCVKNDALPLSGGNCALSFECATDYVCNASGKCATPTAQVICKP